MQRSRGVVWWGGVVDGWYVDVSQPHSRVVLVDVPTAEIPVQVVSKGVAQVLRSHGQNLDVTLPCLGTLTTVLSKSDHCTIAIGAGVGTSRRHPLSLFSPLLVVLMVLSLVLAAVLLAERRLFLLCARPPPSTPHSSLAVTAPQWRPCAPSYGTTPP